MPKALRSLTLSVPPEARKVTRSATAGGNVLVLGRLDGPKEQVGGLQFHLEAEVGSGIVGHGRAGNLCSDGIFPINYLDSIWLGAAEQPSRLAIAGAYLIQLYTRQPSRRRESISFNGIRRGPMSQFPPERTDPTQCPGCKTPIPEEDRVDAKVICPACGQWELETGLLILPIAGEPGTPPEVVRWSAPLWKRRQSAPRSSAPRPESLPVLGVMAQASRLVADGVAPHLAAVGDSEAERIALQLWQRACANDKAAVERILNPLLNDPDPTFLHEVRGAMAQVVCRACRRATLASLPAADIEPEPAAAVTVEEQNLAPDTPCNWSWPLVSERTSRHPALPELARDENRERQSRYCQGFDPDWWLPALVAAKWRTVWYPREAARESVQQWMRMIDQMRVEYLGPFGMPERAAELEAQRDSDLALIRQHAPHLCETGPGNSSTEPDNSSQETVEVQRPVAPPSGPRRGPKEPSKDAIAVYRYWFASNIALSERKTQKDLAEDPNLMKLLGRKIDQGTVSRYLKQVKEWIKAGNVLPEIAAPLPSKPRPIDPERIDLGEQREGRAKHQRGRRNSDRDD